MTQREKGVHRLSSICLFGTVITAYSLCFLLIYLKTPSYVGEELPNKSNFISHLGGQGDDSSRLERKKKEVAESRMKREVDEAKDVANHKTTSSGKNNDDVDPSSPAALKALLTSPDGAIYGNPMDHPLCQDALLHAHDLDRSEVIDAYHARVKNMDKSKQPRYLPPTFWSREALSAMQAPAGRYELDLHCAILANWNPKNPKETPSNVTRAAYMTLGKCGSSSISTMLKNLEEENRTKINRFGANVKQYRSGESFAFDGDCTFTFVRDPLSKLVSAYITINLFFAEMKKHHDGGNIKFWNRHFPDLVREYAFFNVETEPKRFRTFVYEMINNTHEFVSMRPLDHAYTISGNVSPFFGSKVHFIGRVEQLSEHWEILSKLSHCKDFLKVEEAADHHLSFGHLAEKYSTDNMSKILGMTSANGSAIEKSELPQWKALREDQNLLNDVVEHLWQDYVCFGYEPKYPELGIEYGGAFQKPY